MALVVPFDRFALRDTEVRAHATTACASDQT
jgi:hypothetical protein